MDYANKEGIPCVIILGEDELREEKAVQKDMLNGQEYETGMTDWCRLYHACCPGNGKSEGSTAKRSVHLAGVCRTVQDLREVHGRGMDTYKVFVYGTLFAG